MSHSAAIDSVDLNPPVLPLALSEGLDELLRGDFHERWQVIKRVSEWGEAAIAPLLDLIQDEEMDWEVRWFAARGLGQFPRPAVVAALLDLLKTTPDEELRAIASTTLGQFGAMSIAALTQLMQTPEHRLLAVQTLAGIRHPDVLPPLLQAATDASSEVRQVAIAALGNFRTPESAVVLGQALLDPVARVRREAVMALGRRAPDVPEVDLIAQTIPCLWDEALPVREAAVRTLGRLGTTAAIAPLVDVVRSPHPPIPLLLAIVQVLGWHLRPATLDILLTDKDNMPTVVQLEIIAILGRLKTDPLQTQAAHALLQWLQTIQAGPQAGALKQALALALGQLRVASARSLLHRLTTDPDRQVAIYAEAALRQLTQPPTPSFGND